jgi:hypothetical protein
MNNCPKDCECPYCLDSYGAGDVRRDNVEGIGNHEEDEIADYEVEINE